MSSIITIINPTISNKYETNNLDSDEEMDIELNDPVDQVLNQADKVEFENSHPIGTQDAVKENSIVSPGELITDDPTWMRGHGTYYLNESTYSSVAGTILRVNKLLSVIPFKGRYVPETGDHIVGRVVGTVNKRWKVDIGGEHAAVLMLGAINLPGGVLRRKSDNDELQMRAILKEGDLLNAEVQSLFNDGSASLHTRSLKYGKLRNGVFVKVHPALIIRTKNHFHELPGGVSVILGVNGFCWLSKTVVKSTDNAGGAASKAESDIVGAGSTNGYKPGMGSVSITRLEEESSWDIYSDKNDNISDSIKETISRYRNCLMALSYCNVSINVTRLVKAYEISLGYGDVNNLVAEDTKASIGEELINSEKMRG